MGSQKANGCGFAIPAGHMVPAGYGCSIGGHMMTLAACSADRLGHVEVDPCRRIGTGAIKSQRVTMRPEVMNAALRLIKMLQLFLWHSHSGECNFWKRRHCIIVMFPFIASYRL